MGELLLLMICGFCGRSAAAAGPGKVVDQLVDGQGRAALSQRRSSSRRCLGSRLGGIAIASAIAFVLVARVHLQDQQRIARQDGSRAQQRAASRPPGERAARLERRQQGHTCDRMSEASCSLFMLAILSGTQWHARKAARAFLVFVLCARKGRDPQRLFKI